MADVFISYATEDRERVKPLVAEIEAKGYSVWWDRRIGLGASFDREIERELDAARCVVVVWSRHSIESDWVRNEAEVGKERNILVPARIDDVRLPLSFKRVQTAEMIGWPRRRDALAVLLEAITSYLGREPPGEPAAERAPTAAAGARRTNQKTIIAGVLTLAIAVALLLLWSVKTDKGDSRELEAHDPRSLLVLPFSTVSDETMAKQVAGGLAEDVVGKLVKFNIEVSSQPTRPSAFRLTGSVRQRGSDLRVSARLTSTGDGVHIWSKTYDLSSSAGFDMVSSVATNIAWSVLQNIVLEADRKGALRYAPYAEDAMFLFFAATREQLNIALGEGGDFATFEQLMKDSIQADPQFPSPHRSLAGAYTLEHFRGRMRYEDAYPAARAAIDRAFELAPEDIPVQWVRGLIVGLDQDHRESTAVFTRLKRTLPGNGFFNMYLATIAAKEGRASEVLRFLADPSELNLGTYDAAVYFGQVGMLRNIAGDLEGALQATSRGLNFASGGADRAFILWRHALNLISARKFQEARPYIAEGWSEDRNERPERYVYLYAAIGDEDKARAILDSPRFELSNDFALALAFLELGDVDRTFDYIRRGVDNRDAELLSSLRLAHWWDPIRKDPRFDEMLALFDSYATYTEAFYQDASALR